jgi:predicted ATPase
MTANVVDILKAKMTKLASELKQLLQITACLGHTLDERMIALVWNELVVNDPDTKLRETVSVSELLAEATRLSFLEMDGEAHYRWVHDKVQEAALSMIPANRLTVFSHRVGQILFHRLTRAECESLIFAIVNLMDNPSNASIHDESRRYSWTQLVGRREIDRVFGV